MWLDYKMKPNLLKPYSESARLEGKKFCTRNGIEFEFLNFSFGLFPLEGKLKNSDKTMIWMENGRYNSYKINKNDLFEVK